jgi:ubiquinone/menaquinone biosynthesis C-methylase UbiE
VNAGTFATPRVLPALGLALCLCARAAPAAESVAPGVNDRYKSEAGREMAVQIFEGQDRESYQKSDDVIRHMKIAPGNVVCEIGAGSGYFTPYLARAVGRSGKVLAEDPQREFLDLLEQKIEKNDLGNVTTVLGTYVDTNLPDGVCDIAFVLDAYHHFEFPQPMLEAMAKDLKPDGRLIIVDWYRRPNPVFARWKIDAEQHLRLDRDGVIGEIERYGWKHVATEEFLDHQYFLVFRQR